MESRCTPATAAAGVQRPPAVLGTARKAAPKSLYSRDCPVCAHPHAHAREDTHGCGQTSKQRTASRMIFSLSASASLPTSCTISLRFSSSCRMYDGPRQTRNPLHVNALEEVAF